MGVRNVTTKRAARIAVILAGLAGLALAGAARADEAACKALEGKTYPASLMKFANTGARVDSATWVPAQANFRAYCKIRSEIAPKDPKATRTLVATNLPDGWNRKVVQFGGGGLNGTLVEATGLLPDMPPSAAPLNKGYATMGTDGGHPNLKPEVGVFMLNDEAEINNAYAANNNGHNLTLALIKDYYKEAPRRFYFYGHSEGGRQALATAQLFPAEYDGVIADAPSLNKTLQYLGKNHLWMATHNGGWMDKAKIHLLGKATMDACDGLDGIKDGVISQYRGCEKAFKLESLRCPGGADTGDTCLSDKQIAAVNTVHASFSLGYPVRNGVVSLHGWPMGAEDGPSGYNNQVMANDAEPKDDDPGTYISANQFARYGVMQDGNARGAPDYQKYKARILALSNEGDMNNPDLTPFMKRGGKLILKANGGDYQVSAEGMIEYYDSIGKKMGKAAADSFVRAYVNPGVAHGGSNPRADGSKIPDKTDFLDALDAWVERGSAPGNMVLTSYEKGAPAATKPLCLVPTWPRYNGSGDTNAAASYTCVPF